MDFNPRDSQRQRDFFPPIHSATGLLSVAEACDAVVAAEKVLGPDGVRDLLDRIEWFRAQILSEEPPQSTIQPPPDGLLEALAQGRL